MIPFIDLKAQYSGIKEEINRAVGRTLESTQFVLGKEVEAFEEAFAAYCGVKHGVAVNSGTSALHLALLSAGVGPGDEVITVSFTFVATTAAILYCGARPVFVDIDPGSLTMDPTLLDKAVTARTKAILPVHIHGQSADMDPIKETAKKHGLVVIEDAAQAHGAEYKGRRAGSMGDLGCFSFYPGKNLGAYGEGGMVTTNDDSLASTLRMLRDWGQAKKYHHVLRGFNYRMDGLQGAILGVKLAYLDRWTEARRAHAKHYDRLLAGVDVLKPVEMGWSRHVYHVYAVRTRRRDELQKWLNDNQVQTNMHYPIPVHLQEAYKTDGSPEGALPVTEQVARETLSLPMYAELKIEQQEAVTKSVESFFEGGRRAHSDPSRPMTTMAGNRVP